MLADGREFASGLMAMFKNSESAPWRLADDDLESRGFERFRTEGKEHDVFRTKPAASLCPGHRGDGCLLRKALWFKSASSPRRQNRGAGGTGGGSKSNDSSRRKGSEDRTGHRETGV